MSTPGVGPIVALTYAAAIDDPGRVRSSKGRGAFSLTPARPTIAAASARSGAAVRTALYEAT
ncbi:MAG: hypothetical protein EOS34_32395 [Mesorhizobium sp.]|uniref:hypothetical protein n=1 Tax=Mesorhizobium sp. TaxID=1871066 RepID=UPI000FE78FE3|nr:MAG: hypothetical protein EOS34_32395 [Mesorhizobium sp.]RWI63322.1 MAG: hypothetical protein EOR18_31680 [Mesorhizobium sp.]